MEKITKQTINGSRIDTKTKLTRHNQESLNVKVE
jgi:hypothetical protein